MSFFKKTAEEMVNGLFDKWLKEKTFDINFPLTDPVLKDCIIRSLEIIDEAAIRVMAKGDYDSNFDFMEKVELIRENAVLLKVAQVFAKGAKAFSPPPKPTHRQTRQKTTHLRLVVNG